MSALARERILLVNDDGIDGPGMQLLARLISNVCDDVWIIAPDEERSGAAHSLSIAVPVRARQLDDKRYAVKGTPTDCIILAYHELMRDCRPTLVLSGINRGANLGDDVTYSGTTSAALEATLLGIKSVAISQIYAFGNWPQWATAERYTVPVLEALLAGDWPTGMYYNVNFPDCPPEGVTGVRATSQGKRPPGAFLPERGVDGRKLPYYWITLLHERGDNPDDADLEAVEAGAVSITPLHADMTCRHALSAAQAAADSVNWR